MKCKKTEKIIINTLLILSILIFLFLYYNLTFKCVNRYWFEGLIFGIPSLILLAIAYLFYQKEISGKVAISFSIIILIASIIVLSIAFMVIVITDLTSEVTDIKEYKRILNLEVYDEMLYQFPKEVPKNAENVKFFYRPQFLQGGMQMELKMTLDEQIINSYIVNFKDKCKQIINIDNKEVLWDLDNVGIFTLGDHVVEERIEKGFTIYLLESEPYKTNNWNHGYVIFIAVNDAKTEILFQSEVW